MIFAYKIFLIDAVTNYPKLGNLKQHTNLLSHSSGAENSKMVNAWLHNQDAGLAVFFVESLRETSVSLPFPVCGGCRPFPGLWPAPSSKPAMASQAL